ncbi:MAG: fasciclin domain-containing protein [Nitrosomonadaceae bacterium]|nr:fasciclin domain-containing protein [Nitrosospira sp.]MDW7564659.1 fasciclin domain-containing protein [Nitrosomonadaceae bacterium]MBI0409309.1 fasciclin domain-containing protein [Nitrosospira sp.]MBI0410301.1 fasciclin domain-containing protein [Nitrosospira sp.]MBI0411699.1 fasciclin domain-containing protein [Nitrosospira sp.]
MKKLISAVVMAGALGLSGPAMSADIVDTAVAAGSFNTLVAAVKAAGLVEALKGPGPFTVFAPTDDAFAKLPAGTLESLLKDKGKLAGLLKDHVIAGKVMAAEVKAGHAKTLQGNVLTFSVLEGKGCMAPVSACVKVNNATIISTDVLADNGVIHVIDAVISPVDKASHMKHKKSY